MLGLLSSRKQQRSEGGSPTAVDEALRAARPALAYVILFSSFGSLLSLVQPLYVLNIYDRVLTSRNMGTLIALTLIAIFLFVTKSVLDRLRASALMRLGLCCDDHVAPTLFTAVQSAAITSPTRGEVQVLRDLDAFREFWTGPGLVSICEAIWAPIFVVALFILHPLLGAFAAGGVLVSGGLAVISEHAMRSPLKASSAAGTRASARAAAAMRNIEAVRAMGMGPAFRMAWQREHHAALLWQAQASGRAASFTVLSRFVQMGMNIGVLAIGAFLALEREISPAAIFAASILFRLATGPIVQLVSQWKGYIASRLAYQRVQQVLRDYAKAPERVSLPRPTGALLVESVTLAAPGTGKVLLRNISFALSPGEILGIVGPSGAGKSCLARALVGIWQPTLGTVRLDGAELHHWPADELGKYLGYLPQDVELVAGTVSQNVARFGPRDDERVVEAAKLVGVHELIQSLPDGYNTPVGEDGVSLSGGQRQRIALARAAYGEPALVVLDEPNASLDAAGEQALTKALLDLKAMGTTVVLITHKAQILSIVDKIVVLANGGMQHFGERDEVLERLAAPKVVSLQSQPIELIARR